MYDIIILYYHTFMTTISVPLTADLLGQLESFIRQGKASNKAEVMRRALQMYLEEEAVQDVLRARKEPSLHGNLRDLAKKIR